MTDPELLKRVAEKMGHKVAINFSFKPKEGDVWLDTGAYDDRDKYVLFNPQHNPAQLSEMITWMPLPIFSAVVTKLKMEEREVTQAELVEACLLAIDGEK